MNPYVGRNAYVIGGSSGIGLAVAEELARREAHVCLFARRAAPLEQARLAVQALAARDDQRFAAMVLDVTEPEMTRLVLERAARDWGRPWLVVNCAGRAAPREFRDLTPEQFSDTLGHNLLGAYHVARAVAPLLPAGGWLVNVASLAGLLGIYGYSDYCASKFGLVGFSAALRCELASLGIRVAVLCPGDTDTPGYRAEEAMKPEMTRALSAKGGLLEARRVAKALLSGLRRGRFLIVPGFKAKVIAAAQRLCPWLVWRIMLRDLRRAGGGSASRP